MSVWLELIAVAALTTGCAESPDAQFMLRVPPVRDAAQPWPERPSTDIARDAVRKPSAILAFAEIRPGMTVVDVMPGGGYFTRVFAPAVGRDGKVVAYVPCELEGKFNAEASASALGGAYPNVEFFMDPMRRPAQEPFADVVFTAQNYHDFHTPLFGRRDVAAVNRAVFSALKPGGLYVIIDHGAPEGSGAGHANTLHRIDEAQVRREVEAAGFVFEDSSEVLRNPADPRTASVFDPSIRGRTDQFALKFRKPAR